MTVHPYFGFPLALLTLFIIFQVIIKTGEFFVGIMGSLFETVYSPFIYWLSDLLGSEGLIHYLLIGNISGDTIDYEAAMGVMTTGLFMVLGIVLPYIIIFYIVLGFLEDLGYLPRVAIIFDKFLHKIGLHGFSIIPMMLAIGCNVPGIMAVRNMETRRERFITAVITCVTVPCMAQSAIIFSIAGNRGGIYIAVILATLLSVWIVLGSFLNMVVKGETTTMIMEIPPYRKPGLKIQIKTLGMRIKAFLFEAVPYVLGGILFINILQVTGIIDFLGKLVSPIIKGVFGLPEGTVSTFIIGIVRKDAAVALLEPFNLTNGQIVTAVIILILYFPCIATFTVLLKELKGKDTLKAVGIMAIVTLSYGGFTNLLLEKVFTPVLFMVVELSISFIILTLTSMYKEKHAVEYD